MGKTHKLLPAVTQINPTIKQVLQHIPVSMSPVPRTPGSTNERKRKKNKMWTEIKKPKERKQLLLVFQLANKTEK